MLLGTVRGASPVPAAGRAVRREGPFRSRPERPLGRSREGGAAQTGVAGVREASQKAA